MPVNVNHHPLCVQVDIWGAGIVLAEMLFKRSPFFRYRERRKQLRDLVRFFGTTEFYAMIDNGDVRLPPYYGRRKIYHRRCKKGGGVVRLTGWWWGGG